MKVFGSIITVNTNSKILVRYDKDGLHLPKVEVGETMTIKGHIISTLLILGITDVVESDLNLYNMEDEVDKDGHILYNTYITRTKSTELDSSINYKYMSLSELKNNLTKFANKFDAFVLRLFIINPY